MHHGLLLVPDQQRLFLSDHLSTRCTLLQFLSVLDWYQQITCTGEVCLFFSNGRLQPYPFLLLQEPSAFLTVPASSATPHYQARSILTDYPSLEQDFALLLGFLLPSPLRSPPRPYLHLPELERYISSFFLFRTFILTFCLALSRRTLSLQCFRSSSFLTHVFLSRRVGYIPAPNAIRFRNSNMLEALKDLD